MEPARIRIVLVSLLGCLAKFSPLGAIPYVVVVNRVIFRGARSPCGRNLSSGGEALQGLANYN